jgi:hypothetical protein
MEQQIQQVAVVVVAQPADQGKSLFFILMSYIVRLRYISFSVRIFVCVSSFYSFFYSIYLI